MGLIKNIISAFSNAEKHEEDIEFLKHEVRSLKKVINENCEKTKSVSDRQVANCPEMVKDGSKTSAKDLSAKDACVSNIANIIPLLEDLTGDSFNGDKCDGLILSLNSAELCGIWAKIKTKPESVLRVLAFWGFKPELCSSFVCTGNEEQMYKEENGDELEIGARYNVLSKPWLFTDGDGVKKVIIKGRAKK